MLGNEKLTYKETLEMLAQVRALMNFITRFCNLVETADRMASTNWHPAIAELRNVSSSLRPSGTTEDDRRMRLLRRLWPGPAWLNVHVVAAE